MNDILFVTEHYQAMKRDVPVNHRGYLYFLKEGASDDGEVYDVDLGHEIITEAKGFTDNPTQNDLERAALLLIPDTKIKIIPFYKFKELNQDHVNYSDMEEIVRRTDERIIDFFLFDSRFGFVYRRDVEDNIPCFNDQNVHGIQRSKFNSEELDQISKKREELRERKVILSY